ncbi:unnamed protein product [Arabidopsis lyrata]|uniref:KIB1-4 beta-propeller domain-containing protein n=2 Tax=Arabidopsis lyrata subsp. lyrata TaxID=81972 RepID=D7LIW8_ARALL|nr:hypothetical protein ARALYDRAFT_901055 [Arabidopsis lyrata subsp. lyrata]CAH8263427.1 unnamed protein product [Arabidopsis lyrata]
MGWDPEDWATYYRGVAFLPLNKEGRGEEFVVLLNYTKNLYVLRSTEMRWMQLKTPMMPSEPLRSSNYLIASGNDELFLVEKFNPFPECGRINFKRFICRVSRLDEEAGKWVEVNNLGDRVLFIRHFGNVCCSAKELPVDCGVSVNSILFTTEPCNVTYSFKYGVKTGRAEDDLNCWRKSREIRVRILNTFPVVALRLEYQAESLSF